jgi:hypothetical protein
MGLTAEEIIAVVLADLPDAIHIVADVRTGITGLPPKEARKATDYARAFGADPTGVQYHIAELIDKLDAQLTPPPTV